MSNTPSHWVSAALGDVAIWGSGGTPKSTEPAYYGGEIPWALSGDLIDLPSAEPSSSITEAGLANSSARIVEPGSVLIAMYGATIGRLGIAMKPMATNQAVAFAQPLPEIIESRFLFWYLRSQREQLIAAGKGAAQKNISQALLKTWPITVPSLAEQRRIVDAIEEQLSRLDAAEASLARGSASLAILRASLFAAAFHFRPQNEPRLHRAREAEPWELPEGWEWMPFSHVANVASNLVDPRAYQNVPHIAPNHIVSGSGRLLPYTTVADDRVTSSKHLFSAGQLLYSKIRPYLAKATIAKFAGLCSADMYPIDTTLHAPYLLYWMLSPMFTELAAGKQGRSVLPKVNKEQLSRLPVPVAPESWQRRLSDELDRAFSICEKLALETENAKARSIKLRRGILQAAFSGQLAQQNTNSREGRGRLMSSLP